MAEVKRNALFGFKIGRAKGGKITVGDTDDGNDLLDYTLRETGLEQKIQQNNRLAVGLAKPEEYLKAKNEDLEDIAVRLSVVFGNEYKRLLGTGITDEEARKKATSFMQSQKMREMLIHDKNFPTAINDKIAKKLLNTK